MEELREMCNLWDCDIELSNSKYSDEIPEYARLIMGLSITKRENTDNKEVTNEMG